MRAIGWIGAIAGGIVAAVTLLGLLRTAFNRTLGRRGEAQRRLSKLAAGVQINYFTSVLGQPAIKRADDDVVEYVFVDRLFYVHVLTSPADDSVIQFAVTTRARRFHPRARWWTLNRSHQVRLGKTSFAQFGQTPERISGSLGAHNFGYSEIYYLGNPGGYQKYVLAINDAGPVDHLDVEAFNEILVPGAGPTFDLDEAAAAALIDSEVGARLRSSSRPNTYCVTALLEHAVLNAWLGVGVDVNAVRVLP